MSLKRQYIEEDSVIVSSKSAGQTHTAFIEPYHLPQSDNKRQQQEQYTANPPPRYIPKSQAEIIPNEILEILRDIERRESMMIDNEPSPSLQFVFFLGVQGKEFIDTIQENFPQDISVIFITANESNYCDNNQCFTLANHFQIKDPLGGGIYPLDYLYVIHEGRVHCKLPLITNPCNRFQKSMNRMNKNQLGISSHLNFGIELKELPSIVEEYINYLL